MSPARPPQDQDDEVPFLGSWPRLYAAVVLCHLVVMGLVALFSVWPF